MPDNHEPVKIRVALPREAAEYAVRVLADGNPGRSIDPSRPVDLVGPNGSHGEDWPMFARFAEAAILAVIIEEWRKRERPDLQALYRDAVPPLPHWVTAFRDLKAIFCDDVP